MEAFKLWLEFEAFEPGAWDKTNDFTIIQIELADGRQYIINVWTFDFLQSTIQADIAQQGDLGGLYAIPPDLFVKELTRSCITAVIKDLLGMGDLEVALNPSVMIRKSTDARDTDSPTNKQYPTNNHIN